MFTELQNTAMQYITNNDFASAGFMFGFLGILFNYLRKVPQLIRTISFRSLEFRDNTETFNIIQRFVEDQKILFSRHSIFYGNKSNRGGYFDTNANAETEQNNVKCVDEQGFFFHSGIFCYFNIQKNTEHKNEKSYNEIITLKFFNISKNKLLLLIEDIIKKYSPQEEKLKVYVSDETYWDFHSLKSYKTNPPILPEQNLLEIEKDLQKFFDSEIFYRNRDIPYHRGYLLHGVPGSGKTSLVHYLASKYKANLCVMRSANAFEGKNFPSLLESLKKNSFLLIEDFDRVFENVEASNKIDVASMLSCMDGILTPSERFVVFITANNKKYIPEAIIRPGRIDYQLEFNNANEQQISSMVQLFFPDGLWSGELEKSIKKLSASNIPMTKVRELLLRCEKIEDCIKHFNIDKKSQ